MSDFTTSTPYNVLLAPSRDDTNPTVPTDTYTLTHISPHPTSNTDNNDDDDNTHTQPHARRQNCITVVLAKLLLVALLGLVHHISSAKEVIGIDDGTASPSVADHRQLQDGGWEGEYFNPYHPVPVASPYHPDQEQHIDPYSKPPPPPSYEKPVVFETPLPTPYPIPHPTPLPTPSESHRNFASQRHLSLNNTILTLFVVFSSNNDFHLLCYDRANTPSHTLPHFQAYNQTYKCSIK